MARVYTLLFNGYADWEIGNVLPELRRFGKLDIVTVGFTDNPVISMGGLRVSPDLVLSQIDIQDILIFLIPGGEMWEGDYPIAEIEDFLRRLEKIGIPIGAICAATTVLARAGILQNRKHTSNSLNYISSKVPNYSAHAYYTNSLSTCDKHVITASGLGYVEFAMDIFNELQVMTPEMGEVWFNAMKNGQYPDNIEIPHA
ncbi:MAG: thiamine biosynthesis protein ThiJ [Cytophagales bacterium]|nr:thiamine biosynthesis protein ThiJ [Cytophagales bacterium]